MKTIGYALSLLLLLIVAACGNENANVNAGDGTFMKATVGTKAFSISGTGSSGNTKGTSAVWQQNNSTLYLTGNDGNTFVSMSIDKFEKTIGTFTLGDVNSGRLASYIDNTNSASPVTYLSKTGTVTITQFDGKTVEGTFSFTTYNQAIKKEVLVSEGEFKVTYQEF